MATTVAQHSVATFTSPVNGTTPIDANTVRGNDNTTRAAYNDHDADPGIHVQSSTLASRPVAGTAGRKWITEDSGVYTLWFDDGTNWHPVSSENIALTVLAGENLVKGDVVKVTGWNNGQDLPEVVKTTSAADTAFAVITATVSSGSMGYATNTGIVQDVNTAAYSVGTILYANGSGGFTSTKPTSGHYQPVAYVLRANASNGVYYVEFSTPRIVERSDNTASTIVLRDSNGDFSAGTITATAVNATTLDLTNLEVTNIKAKDGTQAIAIADTTGKLTISDGVLLSALTASQAVFTDGSKNLVSNAITGTGNVVMSASPTLTGTVTAATLNATTLGGTLSTAAQPNVTSVGTLSSLTVSGNTKIGGGAASNTSRLMVNTANGTAAGIQLFQDGQASWILENVASSATLRLSESSVERMSINSVGNVAFDTNTLYVDAANNRVGVGTTSPIGSVDSISNATAAFVARASTTGANQTTDVLTVYNADASLFALARYNATQHIWRYAGTTEGMRLDSTGNLAVDTNTLYVDAANNRVGVGTASPGLTLDVQQSVSSAYSGSALNTAIARVYNTFGSAGDTGTLLTFGGANYGSIWTLGNVDSTAVGNYGGAFVFQNRTGASTYSERMRLDSSGNLGLGVTPSAWGVSGAKAIEVGAAGTSIFSVSAANVWFTANFYYSDPSTARYSSSNFASAYQQFSGEHRWYVAPSGTAGNAITFTQAMTLDASGNLGIGTTPVGSNRRLEVGPTSATANYIRVNAASNGFSVTEYLASGTAAAVMGINASASSVGGITAGTFGIGTVDAYAMTFATNNTERARITSGGDFGIGTTSPGARLHVRTQTNGNLQFQNSVYVSGGVLLNAVNDAGNASVPLDLQASTIQMAVSGAEKLRVDGTTTAGQTALLLWDVDNNTLERVTVGAADSGGTGFKVLRIPN